MLRSPSRVGWPVWHISPFHRWYSKYVPFPRMWHNRIKLKPIFNFVLTNMSNATGALIMYVEQILLILPELWPGWTSPQFTKSMAVCVVQSLVFMIFLRTICCLFVGPFSQLCQFIFDLWVWMSIWYLSPLFSWNRNNNRLMQCWIVLDELYSLIKCMLTDISLHRKKQKKKRNSKPREIKNKLTANHLQTIII